MACNMNLKLRRVLKCYRLKTHHSLNAIIRVMQLYSTIRTKSYEIWNNETDHSVTLVHHGIITFMANGKYLIIIHWQIDLLWFLESIKGRVDLYELKEGVSGMVLGWEIWKTICMNVISWWCTSPSASRCWLALLCAWRDIAALCWCRRHSLVPVSPPFVTFGETFWHISNSFAQTEADDVTNIQLVFDIFANIKFMSEMRHIFGTCPKCSLLHHAHFHFPFISFSLYHP